MLVTAVVFGASKCLKTSSYVRKICIKFQVILFVSIRRLRNILCIITKHGEVNFCNCLHNAEKGIMCLAVLQYQHELYFIFFSTMHDIGMV